MFFLIWYCNASTARLYFEFNISKKIKKSRITTFSNKTPRAKSTVKKLTKKKVRSGRPKETTSDDKALKILLDYEEGLQLFVRKAADQTNISLKSLGNILGIRQDHPYKITLV